jgi:hypothetical protein
MILRLALGRHAVRHAIRTVTVGIGSTSVLVKTLFAHSLMILLNTENLPAHQMKDARRPTHLDTAHEHHQ